MSEKVECFLSAPAFPVPVWRWSSSESFWQSSGAKTDLLWSWSPNHLEIKYQCLASGYCKKSGLPWSVPWCFLWILQNICTVTGSCHEERSSGWTQEPGRSQLEEVHMMYTVKNWNGCVLMNICMPNVIPSFACILWKIKESGGNLNEHWEKGDP